MEIVKKDPSVLSAISRGEFQGIVSDLGNNEYHSYKEYWSSSDLKYLHKTSAFHFHEKYFGGPQEPKKITEPMLLGSLVHCIVLTDLFDQEYFVMPDLNFRTNEGKARREELLMMHPGKAPVTDELLSQALEMRSAIKCNADAEPLLKDAINEASFFWKCPYSGLKFKSKVDSLGSDFKYFLELKTTSEAGPEAFSRHLYNMHYDLSLYHYQQGVKILLDVEPKAHFVVAESSYPYAVQVYEADESAWATGHDKWLSAVNKLSDGVSNDNWPGYFPTGDIPKIGSPVWAMNKLMKGDQDGI